MPVAGAEVVIKNIKSFGGGFLKHVNKTMREISEMLKEEVTQNINLTDHSLAELARMGHPYRIGGPGLHHPESWKVHIQSGQLYRSRKSGIEEASIQLGRLSASAFAGVDETIAPHALNVFWGTSKMIPRDFLTPAVNVVKGPALTHLRTNLRDAVINFKGAAS